MATRNALFTLFLWLSVIGLSVWVGGTVFSMAVIVPMWSESLPQSATDFFGETSFNKHIYNFFGPPWMALRVLPVLLALVLGWHSKPHRTLLLITCGTLLFGIGFTVFYIYPINDALMTQAGAGKSAVEIVELADKWILADRLRFGVMLIGYLFLLKAFKLPKPDSPTL